ncbi:DUF4352 domain-containing protein [Nocardia sp. XZ_19_369]|uniref:DUF4352 domain-containing protein n=1 Tax=Nocardia sp. XZ_19_369 TaxID=2769487 RepID=UPI00188F2C79|nr:DUF4352 domain-containing protein [Nocardia sp. XZ_19_369]
MRRLLPLLLLPLTACAAEPAPAPPPPPTTTTEHVRTPQDCTKLTVTTMTVEPGIAYIFGTHAEWLPKGQFIRVRVAITNTDNTFRTTRPSDYHLGDAADRPYPPSVDAMAIKRQPTELTLGAGNRVEVDLWYDIPVDTSPKLLRDSTCVTTIPLPG